MNYIEFRGDKIPFNEISDYIPKSSNEAYVKQFILDWHNNKQKFLFQTSGSTGKPKPIYLSKKQLTHSASATIAALKLKPNDNCLLCINPKFIGGTMLLVRALVNQMNIIYVEASSDPLKNINRKIDFAAMVPLQVSNLIESNPKKLEEINTIIIGGGSVSHSIENNLRKLACNIYATYGMTETASHIALRNISKGDDHYKTLPGIIISSDNRQCLVIEGKVTNNEKVVTNDIAEIIGPSQFKWKGRYDNVINTGGIKINAENLEEKISKLFQSNNIRREFFITGIESEKFGQKITLVIKGKIEIDNLKSLLKSHLDKYEVPKEIIYKSDFILTQTGKINKQATLEH